MISSKDRSGYFGASDTKYIIGNWNTRTFEIWWLTKVGIYQRNFENDYTLAGTNFEHKILDSLNIENLEKDKQIIIGKLRVNLDGNTDKKIYEVKTYNYEKGFDINKHKDYINQVQVQMYATDIHNAEIVAYGLLDKDYNNYFNEIDKSRLNEYEITYDKEFIDSIYLPKLSYLTYCLIEGRFPNSEELESGTWST